MNTSLVRDQELVGYLFAPLTGEHRDRADARLRTAWTTVVSRLGLTHGGDPPESAGPPRPERVAARYRAGRALPQAFLDNIGDVALMSVALRPVDTPGGVDGGWPALYDFWRDIVTVDGSAHLLGTAVILTGAVDAGSSWLRPGPMPPDVASVLPSSLSVSDLRTLVTDDDIVIAPLVASDQDAGRVLIALAPASRDAQLGNLVWNGPRAPLTRYLTHAAKLDFHRAVANRDQAGLHEQRATVRERLDELQPLIADSRPMDRTSLDDAYRRLRLLQAGTSGLVDSLIEARTMRRSVTITAANLATAAGLLRAESVAPSDRADVVEVDAATARDLDDDLDDHIEYLDAVRQRADYLAEILKQELANRAEAFAAVNRSRRERFALYQTAILGVIVMVLTAVQSLSYKVPLPGRLQPAIIVGLGAIALLLSVIAGRYASGETSTTGERPVTARLEAAAAGAIGACVGWAGAALFAPPRTHDEPLVSIVAAVVGAMVAYAVARRIDRRRARRPT